MGYINFEKMRKECYSALFADILDEMGYRNQAMDYRIMPLNPDDVVCGRARTCLATDVYTIPENPYEKEFKTVDGLKKDDVLVATTNGSICSGFWGELLSTAAKGHGAAGCVLDGLSRDTRAIRRLGFPLFLKGTNPLDSKGRTDVIEYNTTIVCGGVTVNPGDIIFGDYDGVVVIPQEIAEECVERALEKGNAENTVRNELLAGASAEEVWNKYHIL